jgi:hypothetical protein
MVHVVENERGGVIACPDVAGEPFSVGDAMFGFDVSSGRGFTGAGRVHIARPFVFSSFYITEAEEGHGGPRSFAVPNHQELTERIP